MNKEDLKSFLNPLTSMKIFPLLVFMVLMIVVRLTGSEFVNTLLPALFFGAGALVDYFQHRHFVSKCDEDWEGVVDEYKEICQIKDETIEDYKSMVDEYRAKIQEIIDGGKEE